MGGCLSVSVYACRLLSALPSLSQFGRGRLSFNCVFLAWMHDTGKQRQLNHHYSMVCSSEVLFDSVLQEHFIFTMVH